MKTRLIALALLVTFLAFLQRSAGLSVKTLSVKTICGPEDASGGSSGGVSSTASPLKIQIVEPDIETKEVAWLGVSTEEAPDAVSSQLGLSPGDGLVVLFVQSDSPAAKAGLQKNDLLVELGDQLLVHPGQFRKLIRRQKGGGQNQTDVLSKCKEANDFRHTDQGHGARKPGQFGS